MSRFSDIISLSKTIDHFCSPITVTKENPYTFDLGHLLAQDPNPLVISKSEGLNSSLKAVARDGAQVLLNQLLVRLVYGLGFHEKECEEANHQIHTRQPVL